MRPGSVKGDELILRCPYCGDSDNRKKGHLNINLTSGLFHCHRCQQSGKVPVGFLLKLADMDLRQIDVISQEIPFLIPGPGSERKSLLERYKSLEGHDAFNLYAPSPGGFYHSGIYTRLGRSSKNFGQSGISWNTAPQGLVSSEDHPLRLVEGPYDVLKENDVCLFGFFPQYKLNWFKGHWFYLVPDGDAWIKPDLTSLLLDKIDRCISARLGILGVIYLPGNSDPDDEQKEELIPIRYFKRKLWKRRSSSSRARLALANLL